MLLSIRWVEKSGEAWMMAGISDGTMARVTSNEDDHEATCFRKKRRGGSSKYELIDADSAQTEYCPTFHFPCVRPSVRHRRDISHFSHI